MSLLSYNRLCELVEQNVITNVTHDQINSSSIDITLGPVFYVECERANFDSTIPFVIDYGAREPVPMLTMFDSLVLHPKMFCLAQSEQVFNLPSNISAEYKLKSSMARIGLEHLNAGWCDAGWNGSVLTLELFNMLHSHSIQLRAGDRIGQIVFFEHEPVPVDRSYAARGRYNNDKTLMGIKA